MLRRRLYLLTIGVLMLGLACDGCRREQQKTVKVMGSTSIQPFAAELGREFGKQHADRKIQVEGGGSAVGLQMASKGVADIGACSRELDPGDPPGLVPVVIARDGVAVIVHPSNPVNGLTTEQIRKIFSGETANWKDVGGNDAPIRLVTREESSGTREAFIHLVMGKAEISRSSMVQGSNGSVKAVISSTPGAIGYMSLGQVDKDVKALQVDGAEATTADVLAGNYKLARPFLFVTKGAPTPDAQEFINFVLSPEGQKTLESEGLIRAK
jgi:phosphate transport system substrate-binding protein